ncbi:MAG: APC family permease [Pirellulaceae bacterium]
MADAAQPSPFTPPKAAGSRTPLQDKDNGTSSDGNGLGFVTLTCLVIANMIGAGVFTSSGYSIGTLGSPGQVMLAWVLCGVWAFCGAVGYGALVKRLPDSGGEYLFLSRLVHPSVGFLAGWISMISGFTAPISAAALGAAIYCLPGTPEDAWQLKLLAVLLIAAATACHLVGVSLGTRIQNIVVIAKMLLIAITIAWALAFTDPAAWQGSVTANVGSDWIPQDFSAWLVFVGSMSWIALSYTGFNAAIYVAGESTRARVLVPRAMIIGTLVVTAIYWLLNYVYVYAPPADAIAFQGDVATIAVESIGGSSLSFVVRCTIVLSMTSSVFAMLLAGPRVYQKMAEDKVLPGAFVGKRGAPTLAILTQASLSVVALLSANLLQLMTYLGLTLSACGALAVLSLFWIQSRLPDSKPLQLSESLCTYIYLGSTLCILAASAHQRPTEFIAMLVTFGVGLLVYAIWQSTTGASSRPPMESDAEESDAKSLQSA